MPRDADGLTPKQAKFMREYLKTLDGKQAAIRAGYSPKAAKVTACRLLTNANLRAVLDRKQAEAAKRAELTHQKIVDNLVEDRQWARQARQIGAAVRADELLGKHLGMFSERILVGQNPEAGPVEIVEIVRDKPKK